MKLRTVDGIVRSALLQRGFSIHWYLQALKYSCDCLRELTFDSLKNVNTIVLPVNSTGAADLPCDFVDWVKIGTRVGQYVAPLVAKEGINRLQNLNASGNPIVYGQLTDSTDVDTDGLLISTDILVSDYSDGYTPYFHWFGFNAGNLQDGFKVIRERSQIQLDEQAEMSSIVLEYISDGSSSDNATKVHPYAQKTIEAYIFWQFKEYGRFGEGERQRAQNEFSSQRTTLRRRLNDMSADDYKRIARRSYVATIKG